LGTGIFAQVNGNLYQVGDKKILHVWGTHYERGYAQGYLLAEETMQIMYNYFFQTVTYSNVTAYNNLKTFMLGRFAFDPNHLSEATGMVAGVEASGVSTYLPALDRNLDANDVLLGNSIVDLRYVRSAEMGLPDLELGCASISSWGSATAADSTLNGNLVISRLMDWDRNSYLLANPILIVHHPSEPDEQKWLSFTYPGLIGALSAISENGSAAFLNVANVNNYSDDTGLKNILFSIRDGLELLDYNDDGYHSGMDIYESIADHRHLSGTLVHTVWENDIDRFAGIVENNFWGTELRTTVQNEGFMGTNLAVTNHFRLLYNPICCDRYAMIQDSLYLNSSVSAKRQWNLLVGAAGWQNNLMAIQYIPSLGRVLWANADATSPAFETQAMGFDIHELFSYSTANSEHLAPQPSSRISIYPNPMSKGKQLKIKAPADIRSLSLYNIKGQEIMSQNFSNPAKEQALPILSENLSGGIYLIRCHMSDGSSTAAKLLYLQD